MTRQARTWKSTWQDRTRTLTHCPVRTVYNACHIRSGCHWKETETFYSPSIMIWTMQKSTVLSPLQNKWTHLKWEKIDAHCNVLIYLTIQDPNTNTLTLYPQLKILKNGCWCIRIYALCDDRIKQGMETHKTTQDPSTNTLYQWGQYIIWFLHVPCGCHWNT